MKVAGTLLAVLLALSGWFLVREFTDNGLDTTVEDVQTDTPSRANARKSNTFTATPGRISGDFNSVVTGDLRPPSLPPERIQATANIMDLLPPDTSAVLWTDSYQTVLEQIDAYSLLDQYRPKLQELDDELAQIGLTLDDFLTVENIGLDSTAPAAIACAGQSTSTTLVFAWRIQDIERLKEVLVPIVESAVGDYVPESMGDAQIVYLEKNKDGAFMIHRDHLFLLASIGWQANVEAVAAQIAYLEPNTGLSSTDAWSDAQAELTDASVWGMVNVRAIHARISQELKSPEALPKFDLDMTSEQAQQWQQEREEEHAHRQVLLDSLLGSVRVIVGSLQLGEDTIRGELNILTEAGSLVQRMLQNRPGVSPLQRALETVPSVLFETKVQVATVRELVELAAASVGGKTELERALALAKVTAGLSGDVYDVFDGEVGVAWTRNAEESGSEHHAFTFTAGLAKPQEAQQALGIIATLGRMGDLTRPNADTGGFTLQDNFAGAFEVFVEGNTLVVTNQTELVGQFAGGGQRLAHSIEESEVARMVTAAHTSGVTMLNLSTLIKPAPDGFYDFSAAYIDEDASGELRELQEKMAKLRGELYKSYEEERLSEHALMMSTFELLNMVAMNAKLDGTAIRLQGAVVHNGATTADLVRQLATNADMTHDQHESRKDSTVRLHGEISDLQRQIAELKSRN